MSPVRAILFDLDGTLVDSAPDLGGAANEMRLQRGLAPLPLTHYRRHCGSGARGMLKVAFDLAPEHAEFEPLKAEFLATYGERLLCESALFPGAHACLQTLEAAGLSWGIVTNKTVSLARPLCEGLGLQAPVLVGGDTTPHRKPHPAPLLEAAQRLRLPPVSCVYVGDDPRDVQAGRAAGMATAGALWGYLGDTLPPHEWGADHLLNHLDELLKALRLA